MAEKEYPRSKKTGLLMKGSAYVVGDQLIWRGEELVHLTPGKVYTIESVVQERPDSEGEQQVYIRDDEGDESCDYVAAVNREGQEHLCEAIWEYKPPSPPPPRARITRPKRRFILGTD